MRCLCLRAPDQRWLDRPTEVQIGTTGRPGWIDVLAYQPGSRVLLVIEVKTELADLGGLERQFGWYAREARRAVRGLGWNPTEVAPVALLLSTEMNDDRIERMPWRFARRFLVAGET
jgi:hypothetical protein